MITTATTAMQAAQPIWMSLNQSGATPGMIIRPTMMIGTATETIRSRRYAQRRPCAAAVANQRKAAPLPITPADRPHMNEVTSTPCPVPAMPRSMINSSPPSPR